MSSVPPQYPYYRRRSMAGPLIMILIGVVFLMANFGMLSRHDVFLWFAQYWPVLLIFWGLVKLAEWFSDHSQGRPTRGIGAGGVCFIIFLCLFGFSANRASRLNWNAIGQEMDVDDDFFGFNWFGQTFTFTNQQEQAIAANVTSVQINSDRGDISVSAWDEPKVKVIAHKRIGASSQDDANRMDQGTQPNVRVEGTMLLISANTSGTGTEVLIGTPKASHAVSDLEIFLPKKLALEISTRRGDITVRDRVGDVKATTQRGDVNVGDLTGSATISLRRGNLRAEKISGDVSVEGRVSDTDISDIGGLARFNGDFMGQMKLSKITKGVEFTSSRTDLRFGKLEGEMTMDSGDLRVAQLAGPFSITTRSKDIHVDDITGDVKVENSNGEVEIHATKLPLGTIDIVNRKAEVTLTLPRDANFEIDARTRRGDIDSNDYPELTKQSRSGENAATGSVGKGGPRVHIDNQFGGITLRKG